MFSYVSKTYPHSYGASMYMHTCLYSELSYISNSFLSSSKAERLLIRSVRQSIFFFYFVNIELKGPRFKVTNFHLKYNAYHVLILDSLHMHDP